MRITKFKIFCDRAENSGVFKEISGSFDIFRYHNNKWYVRDSGIQVQEDSLKNDLNTRRSHADRHYRQSSSNISYFYFQDLECIIVTETKTKIQQPKREYIWNKILPLITQAEHIYRATHHPLTGLPNRETLWTDIENSIKGVRPPDTVPGPEGTSDGSGLQKARYTNINIAILDIDRFKHINDNYTHQYGDIIINIVGRRIDHFVTRASEKDAEKFGKLEVYHLSGEEFVVAHYATGDDPKFNDFIQTLVASFRDGPLPTESEWEAADKSKIPLGFSLPEQKYRYLTLSAGTAILRLTGKEGEKSHLASKIVHEAELAAERAKSLGRDRVIEFSQIAKKFGSIIYVDNTLDLVAVDIGTKVGVSVGQEYWIYAPRYVGGTLFTYKTERSSRSLGVFPKLPSGRCVAYDAQDDMSFLKLLMHNGHIEEGFYLHSIPVGTINHLLGDAPLSPLHVTRHEEVRPIAKERIDRYILKDQPFSVSVIGITDFQEEVGKLGEARVNAVLSECFLRLINSRSASCMVGICTEGRFSVLGEVLSDENLDDIHELLSQMLRFEPRISKWSVGYVAIDLEKNKYLANVAIDISEATMIVAEGSSDDERIQFRRFDKDTPWKYMYWCRKRNLYENGASFYGKLIEVGAEFPSLHTQGGIIYIILERPREALEAFERIAEGARPYLFYLNRGVAYHALEDDGHAAQDFIIGLKDLDVADLSEAYIDRIAGLILRSPDVMEELGSGKIIEILDRYITISRNNDWPIDNRVQALLQRQKYSA